MEFWPEFLAGNWGQEFVAGGVGGMAGVIAGHPLDTIRIHLQQPRVGSADACKTAFSLIRHINSTKGPLAFFKGMGPPLATVAIQNAVTFQAYALFSRAQSDGCEDSPPPYHRVALAGLGAGFIQTAILTPVELIKINLQLSATKPAISHDGRLMRTNSGPLSVAHSIVAKEGFRGLYRGLTITIIRDAPAHALYFGSYEYIREWLHPGCRKSGQETLFTMLTAGGLAGVASWVCCYPWDVVKSRLQAQGVGNSKYAGIFDCLKTSIREEGFSVLWKGLGTAITRAYLVNSAIFSTYELALRFILSTSTT